MVVRVTHLIKCTTMVQILHLLLVLSISIIANATRTFVSNWRHSINTGNCTRHFVRVLTVGPVETITIVKEVTTD